MIETLQAGGQTHPKPQERARYVIGADLGQANDPTAIGIIEVIDRLYGSQDDLPKSVPAHKDEYDELPLFFGKSPWRAQSTTTTVMSTTVLRETVLPKREWRFNLLHLERAPLGTSYPKVVELIGERMRQVAEMKGGRVALAVDATGVGRAVVDLLKQAGLRPISVVITSGNQVTQQGSGFVGVPKRDLISNLQVLMQEKRLKVASGLPEGQAFVRELQNFKYKITAAGNDTYEAWRESAHDDIVLAVAIGCWAANRSTGGVYV